MSTRLTYNYKLGRKLLVELNNGRKYKGTFCSTDTYRVSLLNMTEVGQSFVMPGLQHYFKTEFYSIERATGDEDDVSDSEPEEEVEEPIELTCWAELHSEWHYIQTVDARAMKYIEDIEEHDTIAVRALGSEQGRYCPISVLIIATKHQVYAFDIKQIGRQFLYKHLRKLLESVHLLKIVHNSMKLVDCLYHCHVVKLKNFFDTQITDLAITKQTDKVRFLSDCYRDYLELPEDITNSVDDYSIMRILARPLSHDMMRYAVRSTVYMFPLKEAMEKRLLEPLLKANKHYLNRTRCRSPISARMVTSQDVFEELEKMEDLKIN